MTTYLILGATFAFAAAVQPGPFQAYLVARTMETGWRRTVPAVLAPLVSDGPIIFIVVIALRQLPEGFTPLLQLLGGLFLLFLAALAVRAWRRFEEPAEADPVPATHTLLSATVVNLLNPNPWLSWSLVMGPLLVRGWREAPSHGIALLAGFYVTLVTTLVALVALLAAAKSVGPRVSRVLLLASALGLGAFGVYQLWSAARSLT